MSAKRIANSHNEFVVAAASLLQVEPVKNGLTIKAIMTETGTEATVSLTEEKRVVKPTLKALEYNLQTKISSRSAILGQLTEKKNELRALMDDDANVEIIAKELLAKYETLIKKFSKINVDVEDIFCHIECVENLNTDQRDWFEPRNNEHR